MFRDNNSTTLERVVVRFAGDSGDGMQLTGTQFTNTTALAGNDLTTLPDYPAEIRAPAGTLFGVSGFQIQFSSEHVHTPGDSPDVLVAMNPAALKTNLSTLKDNGIIIVNSDSFKKRNLKLAGYESNPLENGVLSAYQVYPVPISTLTLKALEETDLSKNEKERSKNFFALGITYWMFTQTLDNTLKWLEHKFSDKPEILKANQTALKAGYAYALSTEMFATSFRVTKAKKPKGKYRNVTGNEALALGFISAAKRAEKELFMGGYPITPASDVLHILSRYRHFNVKTYQAEDEIGGIGAAFGAAYAGAVAFTATSGPGIALKTEFLGLAIMTELPLVVVDIQRGGPSTGLPTKTEQSDLLQAVFGRNAESPLPVMAAQSPADCFWAAIEAVQVAFKFTTPVMLLSDVYMANGAEPWRIPRVEELPHIKVQYAEEGQPYVPYRRDPETLARTLAIPGMAGREHRIGGLEKDEKGQVTYEAENHDRMVHTRAEKIQRVKHFVKEPGLHGPTSGELLVVSWGSTYGTILTALETLKEEGIEVSWYHLRWIHPLPERLGRYIRNFNKVLVPEINLGQLSKILRMEYLVDARGFNKVRGLPLSTNDVVERIKEALKG